jgi:hypothetical protein
MLSTTQIAAIVAQHDQYWESQRPDLQDWKKVYMTNFWSKGQVDNVLRTEVAKCFSTVESYLGALYAKNPAVLVTPDIRAHGSPDVAQAVANQALLAYREQVEDTTRLALIFPCAFLKLAPVESTDPLRRVSASALPPWEVIVDATAASWDQQRWIGHTYLTPVADAVQRYGKRKALFQSRAYTRWLDTGYTAPRSGYAPGDQMIAPVGDSDSNWVRIVEVYDLLADKLLIWSPDFDGGRRFLFKGVKVQVGAIAQDPDAETPKEEEEEVETVTETTGIPFKTTSGRPVVPIIPLYLSRDPETPLRGYSLVHRIYDQLSEINLMRTYHAQGVRRMARQWLMRAGFLDEEAAAKIAQGLDGEVIEVTLPPGADLEGNIIPVPTAAIPADIPAYEQLVEQDIQQAGVNAPFVSGQVTGVTATENALLQQYTASQLGRMARTRDELIAKIAQVYNIMLSVILGDDSEPLALPNPVGPTMLSAKDLTGDFGYFAVDSGSTPMGDAAKRESLLQLVPVLVQLGTPADAILKELIRVYDLPESFTKIAAQAAEVTDAIETDAP